MQRQMQLDIRDDLFRHIHRDIFGASLTALENGIVAGQKAFIPRAKALRIEFEILKEVGEKVIRGETVILLKGTAKQIALAEENLIGWILKASGIATAAASAKRLAGGKLEVVSGGWKKLPFPLKHYVREAVRAGGLKFRICEEPFIYLDKNYVEMLGGLKEALISAAMLDNRQKVIQLKSHGRRLKQECIVAVQWGANILMIDTGEKEDIATASHALNKAGLRSKIKLAYAGNIELSDIPALREKDIDILDIGRAIVDAPLLDMRLEVIPRRDRGRI
jgi:nicotinate-nucleotide pyrophosphorylase (carboxylating)